MSDGQMNSVELAEDRERVNQSAGPKQGERVQDDGFVSWLNQRMKVAEWDQYQRGSEDFFDIDKDLEKLSKDDMGLARKLWAENVPPSVRMPFYLDPEREANAPRVEKTTEEIDGEKATQQGAKKARGEAEQDGGYKVPDALKRRYLEADNRFFYREEQNRLAFEDRGRKMVTEHNDPAVAKSLVELAEAKGWSKIKVAGHDDFKREVWIQAQLLGIEVTGYKAKDVDRARLKELQEARMQNTVEHDSARAQAKRGERVPDEERAYEPASANKRENFRGKLLEHGRANYDFDQKNEQSYYVKIETPNGTRMHWGLDLGRAMEHAASKIGDMIELERLGKRPVTAQEKQFDADGKVVGVKPVETMRVEWSVNGIDMSKNAAKVPDLVVNGSTAKGVVVPKEERREPLPKAEPEKARSATVELGKSDRAPVLTGDYRVPIAALEKVLEGEGFGRKAIKRIKDRATEVLRGMAAEGKPAPRVKVYDRNASRERPRERIVSKSKDQQQERSR